MAETSKTADQALRVLEEIAARRGATVATLVRTLGLSRTAVHRAVATLAEREFVDRRDDNVYVIGPAVRRLARATDDAFVAAARSVVEALAAEHGETFLVSVPAGTDARAIAQGIGGGHHLKVEYELGRRHPMHLGASGRAILAHLAPAEIDAVLALADDRAALRRELAAIRRDGFARSSGEIFAGVVGLSVPVLGGDGSVASVTAVVPTSRASVLAPFLPALHAAATELGSVSPAG